MHVRVLTPDDESQHNALRLRALRDHPESFLSGPEDHEKLTLDERRARLVAPPDGSQASFGAFDDMGILQGISGYMRSPRTKIRHTASIYAMYVAPEARGEGVGRSLIDAIVAHLRSIPGVDRVALSVTSGAHDAQRLYKRAGFVEWGCDRDALRVGDRSYDEHHLVLVLHGAPPGEGIAWRVEHAGPPSGKSAAEQAVANSVLVHRYHRHPRTDASPGGAAEPLEKQDS